uniref:Uncharacterized protein n=1 Tax=Eutreptiella gymnastica TaxID=73025 RepID=A0A7S1ND11_9EUGL|mmetsp:Transcript_152742/g.266777  ORF Transcript_152742/g.266777 Transcript_152742/m.266777 type:complete len:867 (+) Transcript_152742:151-2751(+)
MEGVQRLLSGDYIPGPVETVELLTRLKKFEDPSWASAEVVLQDLVRGQLVRRIDELFHEERECRHACSMEEETVRAKFTKREDLERQLISMDDVPNVRPKKKTKAKRGQGSPKSGKSGPVLDIPRDLKEGKEFKEIDARNTAHRNKANKVSPSERQQLMRSIKEHPQWADVDVGQVAHANPRDTPPLEKRVQAVFDMELYFREHHLFREAEDREEMNTQIKWWMHECNKIGLQHDRRTMFEAEQKLLRAQISAEEVELRSSLQEECSWLIQLQLELEQQADEYTTGQIPQAPVVMAQEQEPVQVVPGQQQLEEPRGPESVAGSAEGSEPLVPVRDPDVEPTLKAAMSCASRAKRLDWDPLQPRGRATPSPEPQPVAAANPPETDLKPAVGSAALTPASITTCRVVSNMTFWSTDKLTQVVSESPRRWQDFVQPEKPAKDTVANFDLQSWQHQQSPAAQKRYLASSPATQQPQPKPVLPVVTTTTPDGAPEDNSRATDFQMRWERLMAAWHERTRKDAEIVRKASVLVSLRSEQPQLELQLQTEREELDAVRRRLQQRFADLTMQSQEALGQQLNVRGTWRTMPDLQNDWQELTAAEEQLATRTWENQLKLGELSKQRDDFIALETAVHKMRLASKSEWTSIYAMKTQLLEEQKEMVRQGCVEATLPVDTTLGQLLTAPEHAGGSEMETETGRAADTSPKVKIQLEPALLESVESDLLDSIWAHPSCSTDKSSFQGTAVEEMTDREFAVLPEVRVPVPRPVPPISGRGHAAAVRTSQVNPNYYVTPTVSKGSRPSHTAATPSPKKKFLPSLPAATPSPRAQAAVPKPPPRTPDTKRSSMQSPASQRARINDMIQELDAEVHNLKAIC